MDRTLFTIDPLGAAPRYHRIKENLRQLYEEGRLKPGDPLPGDHDLANCYGVSRLTVRRALGDLALEGLLVRKQGVGTFVRKPKPFPVQRSPLGFSSRMVESGFVPSSRVVSVVERPAPDDTARRLEIAAGSPIFELVRVRLVDAEPIVVETACLSAGRVPGLSQHDLSQSLYKILLDHYGIAVFGGEQFLEPALLNETDAALLATKQGRLALLVDTVAWDHDGEVVEASRSILRGDRSRHYVFYRFEACASEGRR